jgi:hypothetical protein
LPILTPTATDRQYKSLNPRNLADCVTRKQLASFAKRDCNNPDSPQSYDMRFAKAFNPNLILGASNATDPIVRTKEKSINFMNDILIKF